MKKIVLFSLLFSLVFTGCNGQNERKFEKYSTENQPKTAIKVNKEYDKKGNLVRYDSTYSYYYSNIENDSMLGDSVMNSFKNYFNSKYYFSKDPYFNDLFFQDSLMRFDFYTKDYFINRFLNNSRRMNSMFLEMDSLKNRFFMEQFPDTITHKK